MAETPRFRRADGVGETVIDGETFLVEPATQEVFYLDRVTSALWRMLDKPCSATELTTLFQIAFPDQDEAGIARDIAAVTADLLARGLIVLVRTEEEQ
jgi:hypothetical protein